MFFDNFLLSLPSLHSFLILLNSLKLLTVKLGNQLLHEIFHNCFECASFGPFGWRLAGFCTAIRSVNKVFTSGILLQHKPLKTLWGVARPGVGKRLKSPRLPLASRLMLHQICKPQPKVSWKIFPLGFQPPSSPAGFAAPAMQRCTWSSAALGVTELFPELSQPRGWAACSYIPSFHCPLLTAQVQRVNWLCLRLLLYGLTFLTAPGDFFFICSQIISYSFIRVFSPLPFSLAWCFFSLLSAVMWSLYQCHYPWNPSSEWDNRFLTPADLFISLSLYIYLYISPPLKISGLWFLI